MFKILFFNITTRSLDEMVGDYDERLFVRKDFQIIIASINGSGTLTSNRILHKALFRESYNVVGKNIFPSNIEGLPTYYFLRISKNSQCLKTVNDLYVGLNPLTYAKDQEDFISNSTQQLINSDLKTTPSKQASLTLLLYAIEF